MSAVRSFTVHRARALIVAALLVCCGTTRVDAQSRGTVFAVSDGKGHVLHLVGSIHLLDSAAYPLPAIIDRAMDSARVVAFEVDADSARAQLPSLVKLGLFAPGRTLSDVVNHETDSLLSVVLPKIGATSAQVQPLKPWMLSLQLGAIAMQRSGMRTELGLDKHLFERARRDARRIVALETAADQLAMLDGIPPEDQVALLRNTLRDFDRVAASAAALRTAWRDGDVRTLDSLALGRMQAYPRTRAAMFDDRNARWMPAIESLLTQGDAVVVVGAGHLVGDRGLVALLRSRGFRVEQR